MRIIIDCFKLVKGEGKSIGIYNLALNLVRELAKDSMGNEIIVFGNSYNKHDFDIEGITFCMNGKNPLNKLNLIIWELFGVSVAAKKLKADKILFPRGYASMLHLTKEYVIIHDMIPFYYHEHYPGYFNKLENFYIMWRLKASARHADKVITISEASKRDIIKYSETDEKKVAVIHNGCNAIDSITDEKQGESYIIAVTSMLPHKNAEGIIRSYEKYCDMEAEPLPLTIIGIDDAARFDPTDKAARNMTCIKYIEDDRELHRLIHGAKVFLFLSFIEGFGFPPIEAMQLGTPVICSNTSSLPEVAADAAVYVDPRDYVQTARSIAKLINDTKKAEELCDKGKANIKRFSWQKTGEQYRQELFK